MAKKNSRQFYKENIKKNVKSNALRARLEVDAYRGGLSEKELRSLRRSLAKTANQRIVRLERASSKITGEKYSEYGAIDLVREYLGDRRRYSESANYGDISRVRRDIYSLQTFLASKSSTVQGQREIEMNRVKKFTSGDWGRGNRSAIASASNKDFYDFLKSNTFKELTKIFTSEQIVEYYDSLRTANDGQETMEKFEEAFTAFQNEQVSVNLKNLSKILGVKPLKE